LYGTFLGGRDNDVIMGIDLGTSREMHVTGFTWSEDFPLKQPWQGTKRDGIVTEDGFVAQLDSAGDALIYSTYLGGGDRDRLYDIDLSSEGEAVVTGFSSSGDFPVGREVFMERLNGLADAVIAKVSREGQLVFGTFVGGSGAYESGDRVWVTSSGEIYVVGTTDSIDFPVKDELMSFRGVRDAFVIRTDSDGSRLLFGTYLGAGSAEGGYRDVFTSIWVDNKGSVYVAGDTQSSDLPVKHAMQNSFGGEVDGYVFKLGGAGIPTPTKAPPAIQGELCRFVAGRVPRAVVDAALANPEYVRGWGELCNPSLPPSPINISRRMLSLQNIGAPYNPVSNPLVYKCGCP
jgi:hypothetical protein